MKNQLLGGLRPSSSLRVAAIVSSFATLCCIAACGGDSMTESGGTPPPPPQGNGYVAPGYAYIAEAYPNGGGPGAIYQYSIGTGGSLTPLGVASVSTGNSPSSIVADPTGHFVYTANSGDNTISQFAVGAGGALTPLSPGTISLSGVPSGAQYYSLSADPSGAHLYVVASGYSGPQPTAVIDQFSIGANGTLTPLRPAYVSLPIPAWSALEIDPTGAHAYIGGTVGSFHTPGLTSRVFQFAIGPDGTLSPLAPASVSAAGMVVGIVFAPNGGAAYVLSQCIDSNCDGSIAQYTIGNGGGLSATGASSLTSSNVNPVDLAIDGSSAYLVANTFAMSGDVNDGGLYPYTISSAGALTAGMPVSLPTGGPVVTENTYGPDLYVLIGIGGTLCCGHTVAIYSIGSQGELTSVGSTQIAATTPSGMVLIATP